MVEGGKQEKVQEGLASQILVTRASSRDPSKWRKNLGGEVKISENVDLETCQFWKF